MLLRVLIFLRIIDSIMNFRKSKDPEVRCLNLDPVIWQAQCFEFQTSLNKSTTFIVSIKDLVANDPMSAMNALQKIRSIVKLEGKFQIAALSKDLLLITPFTLHMAE